MSIAGDIIYHEKGKQCDPSLIGDEGDSKKPDDRQKN